MPYVLRKREAFLTSAGEHEFDLDSFDSLQLTTLSPSTTTESGASSVPTIVSVAVGVTVAVVVVICVAIIIWKKWCKSPCNRHDSYSFDLSDDEESPKKWTLCCRRKKQKRRNGHADYFATNRGAAPVFSRIRSMFPSQRSNTIYFPNAAARSQRTGRGGGRRVNFRLPHDNVVRLDGYSEMLARQSGSLGHGEMSSQSGPGHPDSIVRECPLHPDAACGCMVAYTSEELLAVAREEERCPKLPSVEKKHQQSNIHQVEIAPLLQRTGYGQRGESSGQVQQQNLLLLKTGNAECQSDCGSESGTNVAESKARTSDKPLPDIMTSVVCSVGEDTQGLSSVLHPTVSNVLETPLKYPELSDSQFPDVATSMHDPSGLNLLEMPSSAPEPSSSRLPEMSTTPDHSDSSLPEVLPSNPEHLDLKLPEEAPDLNLHKEAPGTNSPETTPDSNVHDVPDSNSPEVAPNSNSPQKAMSVSGPSRSNLPDVALPLSGSPESPVPEALPSATPSPGKSSGNGPTEIPAASEPKSRSEQIPPSYHTCHPQQESHSEHGSTTEGQSQPEQNPQSKRHSNSDCDSQSEHGSQTGQESPSEHDFFSAYDSHSERGSPSDVEYLSAHESQSEHDSHPEHDSASVSSESSQNNLGASGGVKNDTKVKHSNGMHPEKKGDSPHHPSSEISDQVNGHQ